MFRHPPPLLSDRKMYAVSSHEMGAVALVVSLGLTRVRGYPVEPLEEVIYSVMVQLARFVAGEYGGEAEPFIVVLSPEDVVGMFALAAMYRKLGIKEPRRDEGLRVIERLVRECRWWTRKLLVDTWCLVGSACFRGLFQEAGLEYPYKEENHGQSRN